MSTYKSKSAKMKSLKLYDLQIKNLNVEFKDIYIDTHFGKTHLIELGNKNGKPIIIFHGSNSTTAYNLLMYKFLLNDFHVYAVDTVGQPGKSEERNLSCRGNDYGKWAAEVIEKIGYSKINCLGVSFGGGIIGKLMCTASEKIEKAVLIVPSGIGYVLPISIIRMIVPLIKYKVTKKEKYLEQMALYMALYKKNLNKNMLEVMKDSLENVKVKIRIPTNIKKSLLREYNAPTFIMVAENDCFFPAKKVLVRVKKIILNCKIYVLKGSGHIYFLNKKERNMIIEFINSSL